MSWFNLGGLNPKFKEFLDKYPNSTVLGVGWAFYWRFAIIVLIVEALLFAIILSAGAAFGGFDKRNEWGRGPGMGAPMQGKLNINAVCDGALAYMTFPDAASADVFVQDCKEGKHPEVIEQYKADMNLGDGATI